MLAGLGELFDLLPKRSKSSKGKAAAPVAATGLFKLFSSHGDSFWLGAPHGSFDPVFSGAGKQQKKY